MFHRLLLRCSQHGDHPVLVCWSNVACQESSPPQTRLFHVYRKRWVESEALVQEMKVNRKQTDGENDRAPR